jgi:hypothetical protein
MTLSRPASRLVLVGAIHCAILGPVGAPGAAAAPEGTLTIAMHSSPVTRWLDPEFILRPAKFHNGEPVTVALRGPQAPGALRYDVGRSI